MWFHIVFDQAPKPSRALHFTTPGEALDIETLNFLVPKTGKTVL
jgi:hypothetical protein